MVRVVDLILLAVDCEDFVISEVFCSEDDHHFMTMP